MHRWFLWLGLVCLILAGAVILSLQNRRSPIRVPLTNERELRILKVSLGTNHTYSTEPYWKQGVRWILPKHWQGFLGPARAQQFPTPYDSLVIWVEVVHPTDGHLAAPKSEQIKARLPEGHWVEGAERSTAGGVTGCFIFSRFERAARQVPLQFHDGTNTVPFTVDNPWPARAASWAAKPLPQTNQLSLMKVVLYESRAYNDKSGTPDHFQIKINARTPDDSRTGWMYWRTTGFDSSGNWVEGPWSGQFSPYLPMLSTQAAPWKLNIEAKEFISMGLVPSPRDGTYVVCPPCARARELGVHFVMVADGGSYAITNSIVTRDGEYTANTIHPPPSATWTSETNWSLRLIMPETGILCVSDGTAGFPAIQSRLRERLPDNGGRIFETRARKAIRIPVASNLTLGLFPISLPPATTNLEAEIIVLHQPAEFFIDPPKQ